MEEQNREWVWNEYLVDAVDRIIRFDEPTNHDFKKAAMSSNAT